MASLVSRIGLASRKLLRPLRSRFPSWFGHPLSRVLEHIEAHPQNVTVHIGPREVYPGTEQGIPVVSGETHVCFEKDADAHDHYFHSRPAGSEGIVFAVHPDEADGLKTGLPGGCADRVTMHNVLSLSMTPAHLNADHERLLEDERRMKKDFLREAFHVLKPGGELWVGHTATPMVMRLEDLVEWGKESGFRARVVLADKHFQGFASDRVRAFLSRYMGRGYARADPLHWDQFSESGRRQGQFYNQGFHLVRFTKPR